MGLSDELIDGEGFIQTKANQPYIGFKFVRVEVSISLSPDNVATSKAELQDLEQQDLKLDRNTIEFDGNERNFRKIHSYNCSPEPCY